MRDIPAITKNLLIINVLMFASYWVFGRLGIDLNDTLGLHFILASDFHIYQLFTYMFMHANITHIFFNMFALWMFGRIVESVWGAKRFLFYYLACGIGAGLIQECVQSISYAAQGLGSYDFVMTEYGRITMDTYLNNWTTVGASGAIYGILLAFGMLFPEERIFIFPLPVPVKAKWFVILYAVLELSLGLGMPGDSVAHFAHLGGMLFGFLIIRYWRTHPSGSYGYGYNNAPYGGGEGLKDKMKGLWDKLKRKGSHAVYNSTRSESDWEYNARKKKEQDEVDRILDKIRKSGYDSLTADEKKKLFDSGKKL